MSSGIGTARGRRVWRPRVAQAAGTRYGTRVTGNTAQTDGGGFWVQGGNVTLGGSARVTGNNANLGAGFLLHVGTIACTGTPKVCANPGSGSDGCFPDDPCGSPCAATCLAWPAAGGP